MLRHRALTCYHVQPIKSTAPKGIGALYVRRRGPRCRLSSLLFGGSQERQYRPGTINVPGVVGFAAAARIAAAEMNDAYVRHVDMRELFLTQCRDLIPDISVHAAAKEYSTDYREYDVFRNRSSIFIMCDA